MQTTAANKSDFPAVSPERYRLIEYHCNDWERTTYTDHRVGPSPTTSSAVSSCISSASTSSI